LARPSYCKHFGSKTVTQPTRTDRILVVDDLPDNCFLIQALLQEEGYIIDTLNNGLDALEYIEKSPPDLLLLDVMMPGIDGFEVTRRIRQNTKLPFLPILLITAHDHPSVVRGLDLGADEFLRKPVDVDELIARVRSLLRLKWSVAERDRITRQREDFVSRLTHDLRTPMIAADRMLTLMQQGALGEPTPAMKEAIDVMLRSNQNLLHMVNSLLEVYRYEAGRKTLIMTPINLLDVVQEVMTELKPLALEKGLEFEFKPEIDASEASIKADTMELRRVITNLAGNALKFTDQGSVCVQLQSTPTDLVLKIEDTGPGIAPNEIPHLFKSFMQGDHRRAGSGLGLHLSHHIVQAHKGKIQVDSELGQGTTFTVVLPRSPAVIPGALPAK